MKNYIPENKSDFKFEEYLNQCTIEEIKDDIPVLLEWMQDMNWQVGQKIGEFFRARNINQITNDLINVFSGNDEEWKYSVLCLLFMYNNAVFNKKLVDEINRMANFPTDHEKKAEVQEIAIHVIESWKSPAAARSMSLS